MHRIPHLGFIRRPRPAAKHVPGPLFASTLAGAIAVALASTLTLTLSLAVPASAAAATDEKKSSAVPYGNRAYIVQMADPPVSAYTGGIAGYAATRPAAGQKLNPLSPPVVSYLAYLQNRQAAALARAGGGRTLYHYGYVFNGFAAELTAAQADRLRRDPAVIAVTKDRARRGDTSSTPAFLGLSGATGVWSRATGENVIIGVVDTGVWPDHLSFSDRIGFNGNASKDGKLAYTRVPGWSGRCAPGQLFPASLCNEKLVGARWFNAGWGGDAGVRSVFPFEFLSARDWNGHGTHTASTAGGNANVPAEGDAAVLGAIHGIAPRARIAAYKACWGDDSGWCFDADSVAAIDQAVADGVDVINFSVGGSDTSFRDPVEIAFLFAADAGVFVATSAGNNGPVTSTVQHAGPWVTTVAAGTHNRDGLGAVTLGNGASYSGASLTAALPSTPMILASSAGVAGADTGAAALCLAAEDNGGQPVLDPAKVAGKVVVCDRGVNPRVNKSLAVKRAGGLGMVLVNTTVNSVNADLHFVPTVHLDVSALAPVKAYAGTAGATAALAQGTLIFTAPAPFTAAFSSRGPLRAGAGDLLKPDVIAPGQDILAAVAPPGHLGRLFDVLSGTSMSSPHVAGLAALLKQRYPQWSPMAIKSALMTSAGDVLDGPNTSPVVIFRQGAGHVQPAAAQTPGLVFDSGFAEWLSFLCGVQPGGGCTGVTPMDASDLNMASIAIGDLAGVQSVKRRVTHVGATSGSYSVGASGLSGIHVAVAPATFSLAPGQSQDLTITFTRTSAPLNDYTGGHLTWSGAERVRVPVVLRPVALKAPAQASGSYTVTFGYSGPFGVLPRGLIEPVVVPDNVADDPTDSDCSLTSPNAKLIPVNVPAGITYARFALFDADAAAGSDIDLCVFDAAGTRLGVSATVTAQETVNLVDPAPGVYTVVVQGWEVPNGSPFKLHSWLLGTADAGNMIVSAPTTATIGATGTVSVGFTGLTPGRRYLGSVAYTGTASATAPTVIAVTP